MFELQYDNQQWSISSRYISSISKECSKKNLKELRNVRIRPLGFVDNDSIPDITVSNATASVERSLVDADHMLLEEITHTNLPSYSPAVFEILFLPSLTTSFVVAPYSSSSSIVQDLTGE